MINSNVQTPPSMPSSRQQSKRGITPEYYDHFRKILKTRQKFPSTAETRRKTPGPKPSTSSPQKRPTVFVTFEDRPRTTMLPQRNSDFYSLHNIPYKNYKYLRPPGTINIEQYLEGTYKLGLKTGIWDKKLLDKRLDVNNLNLKRSSYTSDHLSKARKPQGPSSCLETIYIAKIQLEENQNDISNQKLKLLEDNLRESIALDIKFPSQAYQLNKWTRVPNDSVKLCSRAETMPKFHNLKQQLETDITSVQKSIENLKTSINETQITKLPESYTFFKFEQFYLLIIFFILKSPKQNSVKSLYQQKGSTVGLIKQNFNVFSYPIIGDRLLISLGLFPYKLEQKIQYKIFERFYTTYVSKKASLKTLIDSVFDFFNPEPSETITSIEFQNLLRILCDQFVDRHPQVDNIYDSLTQNFQLAGVTSKNQFNRDAFKGAFISNQMHIHDLIDLISK